jgi:putative hydrolase of the HAD superfamily
MVANRHRSRNVVGLVFFLDADNTLWGTDAIFAEAQYRLLERVEAASGMVAQVPDRLAFVRAVDQALAERHHLGLKYPPALLAQALADAIEGTPPDQAAAKAWRDPLHGPLDRSVADEASVRFLYDVRKPPSLLPGVMEGLLLLQDAGAVIFILTEGHKHRVEEIASALGIQRFVERVIAAPKRTELFRRVLRRAGDPREAFMVGDQISRDLAPAKAAGLMTVYIPGAFVPRWEENLPRDVVDIEAPRFDLAVAKALTARTQTPLQRQA